MLWARRGFVSHVSSSSDSWRLRLERLERRELLAADVAITEFMASNRGTLDDGFGESSDWIEIHNSSGAAVDLQGWHLTDDSRNLTKWSFPSVTIEAGQFLVVFASGRDVVDDTGALHTNFKISKDGEFLALVRPDGTSLATQLATFPEQLTDVSYGIPMDEFGDPLSQEFGYFDQPTPGAANPPTHSLGPQIDAVDHSPRVVSSVDDLIVTAEVLPRLGAVASVSATYRVMYRDEVAIEMFDDGLGADVLAGDRIYTATIPAGAAAPGEMLRYSVLARDDAGSATRWPRILDTTGDDQSPEYAGTVIEDPSAVGQLPLFSWFTSNLAGAHSPSGARASVYFDGQFYDNVLARQRGAFTNADSQKFEFNDSQPFYVNPTLGRVPEINLNAQGDDGSFLRQTLAFESYAWAGAAASDSFLMQMRVNGRFDRVGIFIEQVDEGFLERHGLDPAGALYKFVQRENNVSSGPALGDLLTGVEKKTRQFEDLSDLQQLIDALNLPTPEDRRAFVFDNLNLPQIINYLAVRTVIAEADDTAKNFYLYRDTTGNGEWSIFPWDKDRSFGEPTEAVTNRLFMTHPYLGQGGNQLYRAIFEDPTTREMYLRRLRSVMDDLLQPSDPASDSLRYETRIDQLAASAADLLGPEVAAEVLTLKSFFPPHRENLYVTQSIDRRTNYDQIETLVPEFVDSVQYFVPTDNSLGPTWTDLAPPANVGQWTMGAAGLGFEREPEAFQGLIRTEVNPSDACAACTSILLRIPFVVEDLAAIQELTLRMKYDDGFVAYLNGVEVARRNVEGEPSFDTRAKGHLDTQAVVFENIVISDYLEALRPGDNLLAIQAMNINPTNSDMLISPELVTGVFGDDSAAGIPHRQIDRPSVTFGAFEDLSASGRPDESFLELTNPSDTAVDLSDWRLVGDVEYRFQPGTVVPASGRIFVSPNASAFRQRPAAPTGGMGLLVQGDYRGTLAGSTGTVSLLSSAGEVIDVLEISSRVTGDFNQDGQVDLVDVEQLCAAIQSGDPSFDLTGDGASDQTDLARLVQSILGTQFGDANLDGVFDSGDLVQSFQAGEYEDLVAGNSSWSEGDWDCDGDFGSSDLVLAFQAGGYVTSVPAQQLASDAAAAIVHFRARHPWRGSPGDADATLGAGRSRRQVASPERSSMGNARCNRRFDFWGCEFRLAPFIRAAGGRGRGRGRRRAAS